jgi:dephospho-CoA kinase
MLIIGLTGSIGSGKSTVADIFKSLYIPVYQADDAGRRLLESSFVKRSLLVKYGDEIIDTNGMVNRQKLAGIVFNDTFELKKLNALIHPLVLADFQCWLQLHHAAQYCIHEAAILVESGLANQFDKLIVVTAPVEIRLARVMKRDNVNQDQVLARMKNQLPDEDRLKVADYQILNDGETMILPQVLNIHREILTLI